MTGKRQRVIIMGAAGRDFHNFNMVYRDLADFEVVAFTATQIPMIGGRTYPPELAGRLYPRGIPIRPEEELATLIRDHSVNQVVFSYSDVSHEYVMHKASLCLALGADFLLLGPDRTMLDCSRPVISVCSVRTGAGKSGITRYIAGLLKRMGRKPVVLRHPMPYLDLKEGRLKRFGSLLDEERCDCTIEELEEFEPLIRAGIVVYSGIDYAEVVRKAEEEADILLWDGGNNDLPFLRSDLEIVVLDPHRAGHEFSFHPGETNLRRAEIAVINKVDTAAAEAVKKVEENIRKENPRAKIISTASPISLDDAESIRGKCVLVVEDGPTLTHGGMPYGAGVLAARKAGVAEFADPKPYARGSLRETFRAYPHIGNLLPAMGYSQRQREELKETIEATPCDAVVIATPADLRRLLNLRKPSVRVTYEIQETEGELLKHTIEDFVGHGR
ncbi:Predicted GTPase [Syntrophus gentianae]|uniref:Predicted GTPase n=1 Tax=Syntrophus gentianae TaxID=43775 RepID=A0A1H7ZA49_9BACT|nr:cyclic 2,3-diphosphoglycerate synthase [Syntrophus gentianae]SEM55135.1 Predicted GTPase [Syntrophus gentianae]